MGLKVALATPWGRNIRCGIRTYSEPLAKALAEQGVEVYVVRMPRFGRRNEEILRDVAERVPFDKVDLIHVQHEYGIWRGFEFPFYKVLAESGKPIVTTMHAVGNFEVDGLIAGFSRKVIVHNRFCLKRFSFPNGVIIPHGAEVVETPTVEEAKKFWGIDLTFPVVGYLGFISPYKGLEDLIEAMVKVKAGLIIGGGWHVEEDTSYMERLKRASERLLKGRVRWLGYIPEEHLPLTYACMDIFVYPSRFATESGALIKALSYGRCVIARNLPPFKEKEKQRALITFKDKKDLARKIKRLLNSEKERSRLQKGARAYVESVSWDKIAKLHLELYEELL